MLTHPNPIFLEARDVTGKLRVLLYVNQFFAGRGGEELANLESDAVDGLVGSGVRLNALLGGEGEIVATLVAGDNRVASGFTFSPAETPIVTFTAPAGPALLTFLLTVTDPYGATSGDRVSVCVQPRDMGSVGRYRQYPRVRSTT